MQNKNRVLKRGGFAVIASVFMMLLITLMLLKMLSYTTDTAKRTSNNYLNEQAQLLAFNATEDAVYRISGENSSGGNACTQSYNIHYPSAAPYMFDINVSISYIWATDLTPGDASCRNYIGAGATYQLESNITNGAAVVDVIVTTNDTLNLSEPVRFHRKTLQKL
ncbi:hypothetical protein ACXWTF_10370 [Thiomicrolovo sp. ZZH C-3]